MPSRIIRIRPDSSEQITQFLRQIATKDVLIQISGSNSKQIAVDFADKTPMLLSTEKLTNLKTLAIDDFYLTVETGMKLKDLYRLLDENNVKFPFLSEEAMGTVGGMIGSGQINNNDEFYKISRWVIAVGIALADGTVIKSGAVTYKSVAGYDLPKLFCGSFGTLGVVVNATLRCYPETGRPYGKDLQPVACKRPILAVKPVSDNNRPAELGIADRIKQKLDSRGIFPAITGWNRQG